MDELVAFLRARLDEDERAARLADDVGDGHWEADTSEYRTGRIEDSRGHVVVYDEGRPDVEQAAHIARHDPARVRREVEAKRRILADYERYAAERRREMGGWYDAGASPILAFLAAVHADHPDYRPEWAPTT